MNGYELSRTWFDFCFENPEKIKPTHTAIYLFAVEHCNRLGWKKKFGLPTAAAMECLGIKNYKTYINSLEDIVEWQFIEWVEKSKNQYSANIITLANSNKESTKANTKALDKAFLIQGQGNASIDKPINKEQINIEQLNKKILSSINISEVPKELKDYYRLAVLFNELFIKNLENKGAPTKNLETATFEQSIPSIRLMVEKDGVSLEQIDTAYNRLNSAEEDFWKGIILSTKKLREKIVQLLAQNNNTKKKLTETAMNQAVIDKVKKYD